jgi:hypothetical protein
MVRAHQRAHHHRHDRAADLDPRRDVPVGEGLVGEESTM